MKLMMTAKKVKKNRGTEAITVYIRVSYTVKVKRSSVVTVAIMVTKETVIRAAAAGMVMPPAIR